MRFTFGVIALIASGLVALIVVAVIYLAGREVMRSDDQQRRR